MVYLSVEPPHGITRLYQADCFKICFPATAVELHQTTKSPIPDTELPAAANCPHQSNRCLVPIHVVGLLGKWRDRCTLDCGMLASALDINRRPEARRCAATYEYEASSSSSSRRRNLNIVSGKGRAGQGRAGREARVERDCAPNIRALRHVTRKESRIIGNAQCCREGHDARPRRCREMLHVYRATEHRRRHLGYSYNSMPVTRYQVSYNQYMRRVHILCAPDCAEAARSRGTPVYFETRAPCEKFVALRTGGWEKGARHRRTDGYCCSCS